MDFEELRVASLLRRSLAELDIVYPTAIQERCFRRIAAGESVVGTAPTGTGKTFAYLLPILSRLSYSVAKYPRVLIVVPTRELVLQVADTIAALSKYKPVRVKAIYGGVNINTQKQDIYNSGFDVLVGTPRRIYDLALTGILRLGAIKQVVVDEVDELLKIGFRQQLEQILGILPPKLQVMMFSSTLDADVRSFIDVHFAGITKIEIEGLCRPVDKIAQTTWFVPDLAAKTALLRQLLADTAAYTKMLIFVATKAQADELFADLCTAGIGDIGVIHSNKSQNRRFDTIRQYESGQMRALIATDVVARGLDFANVSHVVNFAPPHQTADYINRIGRTARAGATGAAINMIAPDEITMYAAIKELVGENCIEEKSVAGTSFNANAVANMRVDRRQKQYLQTPSLAGTGGAFHAKSEKRLKTNSGGLKQKLKYKRKK